MSDAVREYTIKLRLTEDERARLKRAAGQAGWSVRVWAEVSLVTLAEVETSGLLWANADHEQVDG